MNEEFEDEVFKFIKGYINYSISSHGRVRNNCTGRILKPGLNTCGYYIVSLCKDGKAKTHNVHRLVAVTFIDNPENKTCVDHINGDKKNNHVSNLRWCTMRENSQNQSMSKNNTSGVKGVAWRKKSNKWHARITIDGVRIHLGLFDSIEDAKQARVTRAKAAFGIYINSCELW